MSLSLRAGALSPAHRFDSSIFSRIGRKLLSLVGNRRRRLLTLPAPAGLQPCRLACEALEDRTLLSAGGGWTGGGIVGSYFANTTETGSPAFVRNDVRLDWASNSLAPGGSRSADPIAADKANFAAVGATDWSATWNGTLLPNYSESYTFQANVNGAFNMQISPHGQNIWTTLFNQNSSGSTPLVSSPYALSAGQQYDVRITFSHGSGPWALQLQWSSPSTPLETIDPANPVGIGLTVPSSYTTDYAFANTVVTSAGFDQLDSTETGILFTNGQATPVPVDSQGNPKTDFGVYLNEIAPEAGTYQVTGIAQQQPTVSLWDTPGTVGPMSYNTTTHQFSVAVNVSEQNSNVEGGGRGRFVLLFTNTGGGVQNLSVMRPSDPGSTTPLDASVRFTPQYESLVSSYTVLRYMDWLQTNGNTQVQWSDRTLPTAVNPGKQATSWEDVIRFANETGKDIWINIPEQANDSYVYYLANLLKYGSDANGNVYSSPQANPYNAPLDPNLRIYFELSNEVWNWQFQAWHQNQAVATQAVVDYIQGNRSAQDYTLGQVLDYDNIANTSNYNGSPGPYTNTGAFPGDPQNAINERYHALRTLQISNDFRAIWGDAAMPSGAFGQQPTIRPLLEWQMGGGWYGADYMLRFLNSFYNNGDGQQHMAVPHPVNYYLYGGGGGWYTYPGDANGGGVVPITNNSFENGTLGWSFSGTAGVVANGDTTLNPPSTPPSYTNGNTTYTFGTHAAYLQGSGSFSTVVNVSSGDTADVFFYAGYNGSGDPFEVEVDGQVVGTFTPGQYYYGRKFTNNYVWLGGNLPTDLHTSAIQLGVGAHTITFVGTGPASTSNTSFIDNIFVGTVGGVLGSGLTNVSSVQSSVALAQTYGLEDTAYEGGLVFSDPHQSYNAATPLQQAAFLAPGARADAAQALVQVQDYGPALVNQYGTAGTIYAISDNTYDPSAPVAQAFLNQVNTLPPMPTDGISLPTTTGGASSLPEAPSYSLWLPHSDAPIEQWLLYASAPGTYTVSLYGHTDSGGTYGHFLLDGTQVPGSVFLPQGSSDSASEALTFTVTSAGLHALSLFNDGSGRFVFAQGDNATVQLASSQPAAPLPAGYNSQDIGSPAAAGSAISYDGRSWTISGGGAGVDGTSDQLQLASTTVSGDHTIVARVDSLTNANPNSDAGVMFRNDTGAGASYAAVFVTSGDGVVFEYRNGNGASATVAGQVTGLSGPLWVKLVRTGNTVLGYYSTDDVTWVLLGSATVSFSNSYQAGLAVSAHNNNDRVSASFTDYALS